MLNSNRKLTARDVLKIYRSRWIANAAEVAERYNISRSMVYKIYRRTVWPSVLEHLEEPPELMLTESLTSESTQIESLALGIGNEERTEEVIDGTTV